MEVDWNSDKLDIYALFGVDREADEQSIKKGYKRLALLYHPDKINEGKDSTMATHRFQVVSTAYYILTDRRKRAIYDSTGSLKKALGELTSNADGVDFEAVFNKIRVTLPELDAFCKTYKGSQQEAEDVVQNYLLAKGNMELFLKSYQITVDGEKGFLEESQQRYRDIVLSAIDKDQSIKVYKPFFKPNAAICKRLQAWAKREAHLLKEGQEKEQSLQALIAQNAAKRDRTLLSRLEERAEKENKRSRRSAKAAERELSDEEFRRIQASLVKSKSSTKRQA